MNTPEAVAMQVRMKDAGYSDEAIASELISHGYVDSAPLSVPHAEVMAAQSGERPPEIGSAAEISPESNDPYPSAGTLQLRIDLLEKRLYNVLESIKKIPLMKHYIRGDL